MTPERNGRGRHGAPPWVATYRLQLGPRFGLDEAAALVPYLAGLGISHLYLSPVFEAVPGSDHGYDVTDPNEIRDELGGRAALDRLRSALDDHGLGLVLDIVPNHQAAHWRNPTWWALLADGRAGEAARVFDVDWSGGDQHPPGTLALPILGEPLDDLLAAGGLAMAVGDRGPELRYGDHRFPLRDGTAPEGLPAEEVPVRDPQLLAAVLEAQHYRLTHWRDGDRALSHRRFFDVTDLAGVRVEDPEVFDRTHALVVELVQEGVVQGLRVDHVDGLADPAGYLDRLVAVTGGAVRVVVEKILERDEELPPRWPVDGTTGYEGGALLVGALVDPRGADASVALLAEIAGERRPWAAVVQEAKDEVVDRLFGAEVGRLAAAVAAALGVDPSPDMRAAVAVLVASFDRYRSYPPPTGPLDDESASDLLEVVQRAVERDPLRRSLLHRIARLLVGGDGEAALEARRRLGQATGAVAAKGVEDTALYRWVGLPAAGDVGSAPWPPGRSAAELHAEVRRLAAWPGSLVATSTHDSKRSEDVRARLALLPELGPTWTDAVRRWDARLRALDPSGAVDGLARLVLLQTLVGAWPLDGDRLWRYLEKALREAKRRTSWRDPDDRYERAVARLVDAVGTDRGLTDEIGALARSLCEPGRVNGLALTLGKVVVPGVPDVYQGNEVWRLDLTDPDNRRPVDWERRRRLLDRVRRATADEVWPEPEEGMAKLWLLHRALATRWARPEAFSGRVTGLPAHGPAAEYALGLVRDESLLGLLPRHPIALGRDGGWRDTAVDLPAGEWADILVPERRWSSEAPVPLAELLAPFPVALLERAPASTGASE